MSTIVTNDRVTIRLPDISRFEASNSAEDIAAAERELEKAFRCLLCYFAACGQVLNPIRIERSEAVLMSISEIFQWLWPKLSHELHPSASVERLPCIDTVHREIAFPPVSHLVVTHDREHLEISLNAAKFFVYVRACLSLAGRDKKRVTSDLLRAGNLIELCFHVRMFDTLRSMLQGMPCH